MRRNLRVHTGFKVMLKKRTYCVFRFSDFNDRIPAVQKIGS